MVFLSRYSFTYPSWITGVMLHAHEVSALYTSNVLYYRSHLICVNW